MLLDDLGSYERRRLSPNALTLLCDFAAGDPSRPLHRLDADWDEVYVAIDENGLVGLTYHYLIEHPSAEYPPPSFQNQIVGAHKVIALRMALMYRYVKPVLQALNASRIPYLVVKGPTIAQAAYPDPLYRIFNDLDLIVHEQDWSPIDRLLVSQDYEQDEGLPDPPAKLVPKGIIQETGYDHRETGMRVEVHYDDILNAGLASRDIEGFWARSAFASVQGVPCRILSLEDQIVHLCAHAHFHGYSRLNWLSDLALLIGRRDTEINWRRLIGIVETEEAQVQVYYTLSLLERLLGVRIPSFVLQQLRPDAFRRWVHDQLAPPGKILSLEPFPYPYFSFYFVPVYRRLIPDLLVSGRRKEKLSYLLHLLAPSRAWLKYYYHLENTRWLWLHSILHPLRLLGVFIRETCDVVRRGRLY
jgi:hypothetical protein